MNVLNGKVYFGKTNNFTERKTEHIRAALVGSHFIFHKAIRKYGPESFEWSVVAEFESDKEACDFERETIFENGSIMPGGYNMTEGGDQPPSRKNLPGTFKGKKHSEETKAKIKAARAKQTIPPEIYEKNAAKRRGKPMSAETKAKISAANSGRPSKFKGVPRSQEAKENISKAITEWHKARS